MARPIIDFPAPDSPTTPRMRPGPSRNETSRSTGTGMPLIRAVTVRSRASSTLISSRQLCESHVESAAQAVAQEVER